MLLSLLPHLKIVIICARCVILVVDKLLQIPYTYHYANFLNCVHSRAISSNSSVELTLILQNRLFAKISPQLSLTTLQKATVRVFVICLLYLRPLGIKCLRYNSPHGKFLNWSSRQFDTFNAATRVSVCQKSKFFASQSRRLWLLHLL